MMIPMCPQDDSSLPIPYLAEEVMMKLYEADMIELPSLNEVMQMCNRAWIAAFLWYNRWNDHKMGMGCRPCYYKVYDALRKAKEQHDKIRDRKKA